MVLQIAERRDLVPYSSAFQPVTWKQYEQAPSRISGSSGRPWLSLHRSALNLTEKIPTMKYSIFDCRGGSYEGGLQECYGRPIWPRGCLTSPNLEWLRGDMNMQRTINLHASLDSTSTVPRVPPPKPRKEGWGDKRNEIHTYTSLSLFMLSNRVSIPAAAWGVYIYMCAARLICRSRIPVEVNLEDERLILAHSFRSFSPWTFSPISLGCCKSSDGDHVVEQRELGGGREKPGGRETPRINDRAVKSILLKDTY